MWLLQSDEALNGRQLWLRPGKTYLFGRTVSEAGQLAISHNTISRKHLTISVDNVQPGHAYNLTSRSGITIEDLKTKIGTVVNGRKIKGERFVVDTDKAEFTMGKCPSKFLLSWNPVVFTFSFTKKELQTQPLTTLQDRFENLDVKLLTEYSAKYTTHVVSKKRNTAKGLQALINGKHIVTETFLDAVVRAATPRTGIIDGSETSDLEQDYGTSWPDPIKHLPPPGGEPVQHPDDTYSPDPERQEVFEGYIFIFYDQAQYDNLLAPITSGGGKAFLERVEAGETEVDDFVQRVKAIAGEQSLGGGGKGAVLVRFVPAKGDQVPWYTEFFTAVSLRLDHRPIEQSEFLEAILIKDASILRRPLEVDESATTQPPQPGIDVREDRSGSSANAGSQVESQASQEVNRPPARRGRTRTAVKRRFAGFDNDSDVDMDDTPSKPSAEISEPPPPYEEEGLFMSQGPDASQEHPIPEQANGLEKKRSSLADDDDIGDIAPAAARFKRQRLERGDHFASPEPEPEPEPAKAPKRIKKELDVLAIAAQNREQEEARARAEKEDLAHLPDDIDLSQIRKLQIVEKMEVRKPSSAVRDREADIANGRWDPKWNGMKNFKKFRRRGQITGRAPAKVIISLNEVKNKEFGVGDDYWLENESSQRKKKPNSQPSGSTASRPTAPEPAPSAARTEQRSDSEDEDSEVVESSSISQRQTRTAQRESRLASQSSRDTTQSQGKRSAPDPPEAQPAKRPRQTRRVIEIADSDSDDDLKFRFGKRR